MSSIIDRVFNHIARKGDYVAGMIAIYVALAILALTVYAACLLALALAINTVYGPVIAAFSVAAAAAVLICIFIGSMAINRRVRRRRARRRVGEQAAGLEVTTLVSMLPIMLRTSPAASVIVIAAASFILTRMAQQKND
jgi:hypothetical protein